MCYHNVYLCWKPIDRTCFSYLKKKSSCYFTVRKFGWLMIPMDFRNIFFCIAGLSLTLSYGMWLITKMFYYPERCHSVIHMTDASKKWLNGMFFFTIKQNVALTACMSCVCIIFPIIGIACTSYFNISLPPNVCLMY